MTNIDRYYLFHENSPNNQVKKYTAAERIAFRTLQDCKDRRGWRQAWDTFDDDIVEEIIETWIKIAEQAIEEE